MEQSISQKILRNTVFNAIGRFWGLLVALLLTPYILSVIGKEAFAIWALIWVITGYIGILDLGLASAMVRFISFHHSRGDSKGMSDVINSATAVYLIAGVFITGIIFLYNKPILIFLDVPETKMYESSIALKIGIIAFSVSNLYNIFNSALWGIQRMDITVRLGFLISLPLIAGTIFFLESGYGLIGLVINNLLIGLMLLLGGIILTKRQLRGLEIKPWRFSVKSLRKVLGFGLKVQGSRVSSLVKEHYNKIIISHFFGIILVAYYEVASRIVQIIRLLPQFLHIALVPASAEVSVKYDKDSLWLLYKKAAKFTLLFCVPIIFFIFMKTEEILLLWLGRGFDAAAIIVRILIIGVFIELLSSTAIPVTLGMGRPEMQLKRDLFEMTLSIILCTALIQLYGLYGALLGLVFSISLASIYFFILVLRCFNTKPYPILKLFFTPVLSSAVAMIIPALINIEANSRTSAAISLSINGALFFVSYLGLLTLIGDFDEYDKFIIKERLPMLWRRT